MARRFTAAMGLGDVSRISAVLMLADVRGTWATVIDAFIAFDPSLKRLLK
jgi:hypothetical protein